MPARRCPLVYRSGLGGRPSLAREVRDLIRKMSRSNATWGAPRIRNELAKLGIELSRATIAKYMIRHRKPPSPTWRAFLDNHLKDLVLSQYRADNNPVGLACCRLEHPALFRCEPRYRISKVREVLTGPCGHPLAFGHPCGHLPFSGVFLPGARRAVVPSRGRC